MAEKNTRPGRNTRNDRNAAGKPSDDPRRRHGNAAIGSEGIVPGESAVDAAANPDDTPPGAAGSRQREAGRRPDSLHTGAPRSSAGDASRPMAGTSRRRGAPGSGAEHRDGVRKRASDPDATQPREPAPDVGRGRHPIEGDKRPKRGLLSRLNPFSRQP